MLHGIQLMTKGEFPNALKAFRACIQSVPLLALESAEQKAKVDAQIIKVVEYITAIRCEIERKRLVAEDPQKNQARIAELACYMTLCGMEAGHKFLASKVAMNICYKMENNVTAAHFARSIIDLEPTGIFASKPDTIN